MQTYNFQLHPITYYVLHWAVSALALYITAMIVPGFRVRGFISALFASAAIGLANLVIFPFFFFLSLPITILTLGLFLFVVNAAVLRLCAALLPGFAISGWLSAIFGWIVLTLISTGLHYFLI